jgi:hypothetical protein
MMFAAAVGHRSGRATPSLRDAPQQQSMEMVGTETIYRNRNAVQTNPATSGVVSLAEPLSGALEPLLWQSSQTTSEGPQGVSETSLEALLPRPRTRTLSPRSPATSRGTKAQTHAVRASA